MPNSEQIIDWEQLRTNPAYEVARICKIETARLEHALTRHSALYGYAHASYEEARAEEGELEWEYEQRKAEAFSALRDEGEAIGSAQEKAELDPAVQEARQKLMKAEKTRRILWALVQGLEHRKDMLVQLSARQRAEMNQ